ncbi:MAG: hypothetical protein ACUVXB_05970 [Bryobacteraceae bacterium]
MPTCKQPAAILTGAALTTALGNTAAALTDQHAGALVLVNSHSPDSWDWAQWIEPYFRVFGVPYEVRDLARPGTFEELGRHALIVIGHRTLDAPRRFLSGVMEGLKPYRPVSVTLDELCRYARALHTSRLSSARYDAATGQGTAYFEGVTDVVTKFYVWKDSPSGPLECELEVPPFQKRQTARWSAHARHRMNTSRR